MHCILYTNICAHLTQVPPAERRVARFLASAVGQHSRDPLLAHLPRQRQRELGLYGGIGSECHFGAGQLVVRAGVLSEHQGDCMHVCFVMLASFCRKFVWSKGRKQAQCRFYVIMLAFTTIQFYYCWCFPIALHILTQPRRKIIQPFAFVCCYFFRSKAWMRTHLSNDWLAGCWFIFWGTLLCTLVVLVLALISFAQRNGLQSFIYGTG